MQNKLGHYPDRYEIAVRPRSVSRVYVENGFDLQFFDDLGNTGVRIENPIAVVTENPKALVRKDGSEEDALGKIVVSGSAMRKGRMLEIVFAPGVRFWVEPNSNGDDGWGPYGIQGQIIICLPGGQMSIWAGRPKRTAMSVAAEFMAETAHNSSAIID